ncbi:helix-turn-helix transcriptional regulator [Tellurirhabdus bombi]|uniref:helix-turn-helix transcriptional regulator n=1 Tax=Tellurirhabdus bombi TaxID=2907205 RepID=UPI00286DCCBD|nr:helix-turn-helix transcriptional regulator [Tellurirhabdus bombi]
MITTTFNISTPEMTINEKIVGLREKSGLNKYKFSQLVKVAASTMGRIEEGKPVSDDTLEKIANSFDGVTLEWLRDESRNDIPEIRFSDELLERSGDPKNEGACLRRFLLRHDITQVSLAEEMGVSRTQVHYYKKTERFRRDVRDSILAAIKKIYRPDVSEEEIFGSRSTPEQRVTGADLRALPTVTAALRKSITTAMLHDIRVNFSPVFRPESATYVLKDMFTDEEFERGYAIEITHQDHMEPLLPAGHKVLGVLLDSSEYNDVTDGIIAVKIAGAEGVLVKKIVHNNLRTSGILELSSYDTSRGGSMQLRRQDIEMLFKIRRSLGGEL